MSPRGWPRVAVIVAGSALVAGTGCQRPQAPGAPPATAPRPSLPPGAGRAEPAFTHPMLAAATTDVVREDCSRRALATVVERVRGLQRLGPADPSDAGKRRGGPKSGCPSAAAAAAEGLLRGELLSRIGACVGRDGRFDVEWAMLNSAALSLGICVDCGQARDERLAQCRRAQRTLGGVDEAVRAVAP